MEFPKTEDEAIANIKEWIVSAKKMGLCYQCVRPWCKGICSCEKGKEPSVRTACDNTLTIYRFVWDEFGDRKLSREIDSFERE